MKSLISTLAIMATLTTALWAQEKANYKEDVMFHESEIINVSADRLWQIVGPGFKDAALWSTAVDHATVSGSGQFEGATCDVRTCDINASGFSKIKEKITMYNDKNLEFAFDVTEGNPGFVKKANSHWEVISVGPNQSRMKITLTMHTTKFMGTLMGGMMKGNVKKVLPTLTRDLKVYAETGDVSEEKKARMLKLAKKSSSVAQR